MHDINLPEEARIHASMEHHQATQGKDGPPSPASPRHLATRVLTLPSLATLAVAFFSAPPDILEIMYVMGGKH